MNRISRPGAARRRGVRRFLVPAMAVALAATATVALSPGARATAAAVSPNCNTTAPETVRTTLGTAQAEATFNDPVAHGGRDLAQLNEMVRLINCTPSGATIRMAIYSISANFVYQAIKDAVTRGVTVQAVQDGTHQSADDSSARDLAALLGSNNHWCDHGKSDLSDGGGCISTDSSGIMHAKYMLFSQTEDLSGALQPNVVWFGSPNETYNSGTDLFNNSVAVFGDATLFANFGTYEWTPMWKEQSFSGNDFYDAATPRGYFGSSTSNVTAYASPEQQTDLVANRLSYLHPDSDCRVRVMEASIHSARPEVVDQLVSLRKGGCSIWVAVDEIDASVLKTFINAGIPVHHSPIHDKLIFQYARYADDTSLRYTIFTGSHNLTLSALSKNDELFVKLQDVSKEFYTAFYNHFNDAYNTGTVCTASGCPAS